jgi:hypothetical protein
MTIPAALGQTGRIAAWTRRELDALTLSRPALAAALQRLWRRPDAVCMVLAAITAGSLAAVIPGGDAGLFRDAGLKMMGPDFFDVFSNGGLQIGPVYLTVVGGVAWVLNLAGSPLLTRTLLAAAQAVLLLWCALALVRRSARRAGVPDIAPRWAVGLLLAIGGFLAEATGNGHPEEILVGLLLAHAALWAVEGRGAWAGLALGLAGGLKQWAAFGGGVLVLGRRWRVVLVGAGVALVVVAVLYGPFFAFGTVRTYGFQWGFDDRSVLGRLGAEWGLTDWGMRVIQGAAAGAAGAWAAWRRRNDPLVPVVVAICVRLLLDPLRLTYYSGPLVAVLAVWAWTSTTPAVGRWRLPLTFLMPLTVIAPYLMPGDATWFAGTALLLAALAAVLAAGARGRSKDRGDRAVAIADETAAPATTLVR